MIRSAKRYDRHLIFCRTDAEAAADKLHAASGSYHRLDCTIEKVAKFGGRWPSKGKPRMPTGYEYQLHLQITPNPELVDPLRMEAGCFVLVSSLDRPKELKSFSAGELLRLYLCWHHNGFNVYCGPTIWPNNAQGLEDLARYIIRACFFPPSE